MRFEDYFPFGTLDILSEGIKKDYRINDNRLIVEVPGFNKKDLSIEIEDGILRIGGKKEFEGKVLEMSRNFRVPPKYSTDTENIKAKVEDGLLVIEFSSVNKKKLIEIS